MEIVFLGTSSGTPTRTRNVSAIAVRRDNSKFWSLVDCGEGTQQQILRTNLALNSLQAIFITHVHGDHCYGLPGLLASASMAGRTDPLWIIGPPEIKVFLDAVQLNTQLRLPYSLRFICTEDVADSFTHQDIDFDVETVALSHRVPSFAYVFSEKNIQPKLDVEKLQQAGIIQGPLWGRIQQGEDSTLPDGRLIQAKNFLQSSRSPRKIIIAGDNDTPGLLAECAKTAQVLVHESTYTHEVAIKVGSEPQHSSAKIVAQFADECAIENLVLTHFSPRYQDNVAYSPSIADIEAEAKNFYHGNLFLAKDFDIFHLDKMGCLDEI